MRRDLRSVLITGAATSIGYALAQRLDAADWRVVAGVPTRRRRLAPARSKRSPLTLG